MFFDVFKALCDKKGVSPKRATEEIGLSNSITTKMSLNDKIEYPAITDLQKSP